MLESEIVKKIEDFVYSKPRSVQEIAQHIEKSWRTADRYVEAITKDYGTLATRTFREGTRGALKIVFWASVEKVSSSVFQEKLEEEIMNGKKKEDFSAFDIFQHVPDKNKEALVEESTKEETDTNLKFFSAILRETKKQLLFFSGNLSFINMKNKDTDIFKILDELVKKGISIKAICRVDVAGKENIERLLSLNFKHGKELVEIHHREQPLRAFISDNRLLSFKEIKEPTGKTHELSKKLFIYYRIKDKEWIEWLTRIFWKMFSSSIGAKKRLSEMKKLK